MISDGLACFRAVASEERHHLYAKTGGDLDKLDHSAFNWVNTMIGNVKTHSEEVATLSHLSIYQGTSRSIVFDSITDLTYVACCPGWQRLR